jgi:hypothetical protein
MATCGCAGHTLLVNKAVHLHSHDSLGEAKQGRQRKRRKEEMLLSSSYSKHPAKCLKNDQISVHYLVWSSLKGCLSAPFGISNICLQLALAAPDGVHVCK